MIKRINGQEWFCCPRCGQKIHPVLPGARGVIIKCTGRMPNGKRCGWSGEVRNDSPGSGYKEQEKQDEDCNVLPQP